MEFNKIDLNQWSRREIYQHYLTQQTSFSITTDININELYKKSKTHGYKFYPVLIYMITKIVNSHSAFRMGQDDEGKLGYWNQLEPLYTIFDEQTKLFSAISTSFSHEFKKFNEHYLEDTDEYNGKECLFPKQPVPENVVSISMIPWTTFSGFNLNINSDGNYLLPIVTVGKFVKKEGTLYLPVSLQVHHAVCDGYHAGIFMNQLQEMADCCDEWL